ncbi:Staphylococcal nuclease domain-containing protein 1 [Hondaea fermentalgiana]|uniref:Staphylococcal nuclease domain-containing protein 1 n=1 Tax=Hondaea fermentalgiana TaxID=2315210 RepID=A0A2R5G8N1_9STRA|nr:Staphylococcal nuclease domain-containing protein 1 [Hondaea fermentalgiana]|eukprot:GBG26689.1 Staphylococcal nuclease domain-containing protein 1 [Hondaea fermentalgiana]
MATGFATVKEVLSGDTLVLVGQPKNGPPPELRLTLSSLQAPRLAQKDKGEDEPFAWQAREFLRRACVGKLVTFQVEYSVASINRQFGAVRLQNDTKDNLCVVVARAGWARVKHEAPGSNERSADYDEMVQASEAAEKAGLGIFNTDPAAVQEAVRDVKFEPSNPEVLLREVKGKPQRAIVEYVRDGAAFKVFLVDHMVYLNLNLAGVQCPRLNGALSSGDSNGSKEAPQPFAPEAKYFTEVRLLNRDVHVMLNGMDDRLKTFYGTIEHPAGDISVELLRNGLARTMDWSMQFTTIQHATTLRAAARDAKNARLRIWKDYVAPKVSGQKSYEGVVSEIVSGDTIFVRIGSAVDLADAPWKCTEERVTLSSIRAPRLGARGRPEPGEPLSTEARELLRTKALGKRCNVMIEYERAPAEGAVGMAAMPRKFGSVLVQTRKGRKNVALMVVEEGLAEVLRHRADDERSQYYDELAIAQDEAKNAKRGLFSPTASKDADTGRPQDLTSNKELARAHLTTLQSRGSPGLEAGSHRAVVDYVLSGSRLRVVIPQMNCILNFALGGVVTPQRARPAMHGRPATSAEPWSNEAYVFARSLLLQREVVVEIESMDKAGTAIGQCWVKRGQDKVNASVLMVQMGLASVHEYSARYTSVGEELKREMATAQAKRLRMWEKYVPEAAEAATGGPMAAWGSGNGAATENRPLEKVVASVSEIANGHTFFIQTQSAAAQSKMEAVTKEMQALASQHGTTPGGEGLMEPRRNQMCVALFDDGSGMAWYRARILSVIRESGNKSAPRLHIRYVDFGNEGTVEMSHVRPMPNTAVCASPALARECVLAFTKTPALDREYGREAAMLLSDLVFGKSVTAKLHPSKNEEGYQLVSLYLKEEDKAEDEQLCVAEVILREGLGYCDKRTTRFARTKEETDLIKLLEDTEQRAHRNHINLWRYGDPREED